MTASPPDAVPPTAATDRDRFWLVVIGIVSVLVSAAVAFLILGPRPAGLEGRLDVSALPHVNAALNATAGVLLVVAWRLILRGDIARHRATMLAAFAASGAFLVSYVLYHWFKAGPKSYEGAYGWFYYPMLLSHIVLAAIIVPLALVTLYRGWHWERLVAAHRRIAKVTLPLWLYVSVTGVLIWAMLYL